MIIVKLNGGLGNQLFQYAASKSLACKLNTCLKFDLCDLEKNPTRSYALSSFNIKATIATRAEVEALKQKSLIGKVLIKTKLPYKQTWYTEPHFHFDPRFFNLKDNTYVEGYMQSENYFSWIKEIIADDLSLITPASGENEMHLREITTTNSVSLHVRRNDYVNNPQTNRVHGTCNPEYYSQAVKMIASKTGNPHFFIFSDDHEWVKTNLRIDNHPTTYVTNNDAAQGHEDLRLMYHCRHNIIANSSFSWWGAWLNRHEKKIIISPKKWFNMAGKDTKDLIPKSWIRI